VKGTYIDNCFARLEAKCSPNENDGAEHHEQYASGLHESPRRCPCICMAIGHRCSGWLLLKNA
jgi:hypothetical protein